jgi:hypothetical protein
VEGWWFSPATPVSSYNKTDSHDIPVAEILLKMALNTITLTLMKIKSKSTMFKVVN